MVYQQSLERAMNSIYDTIFKDPASGAFKDASKEFIAGRINELTTRVFSRELNEAMKKTKTEIERLNNQLLDS